jgi:hypothetical protein
MMKNNYDNKEIQPDNDLNDDINKDVNIDVVAVTLEAYTPKPTPTLNLSTSNLPIM